MTKTKTSEVVKSVHYANARLRLEKLGVTDFQIWLIEEAEERHFEGSPAKGYRIQSEIYDPRGELEWAKHLQRAGIVERIGDRYWLTRDGESFRENLLIHKPGREPANLPAVASFEEQMDVDLFRDGLLKTVGKIYWFWANHDLVKERRMQEWLREFQDGQKEIDEAIAAILAPRDPIIVQPKQEPNPYWTEEHQRKQNDDYWATGGAAFWFNPRGILAEPTPAPDWWEMPEYKPKVVIPKLTDDVVEKSLLPPPATGPKGEQGPPGLPEGLRHATEEEIAEKRREKALDELFAELDHLNEVEDEFYDSEDWYEEVMASKAAMSKKAVARNLPGLPYVRQSSKTGLFIVEYNNEVHGFPNQGEANQFLNVIRAAERERIKHAERAKLEQEERAYRRQVQDDLIKAAKRKIKHGK